MKAIITIMKKELFRYLSDKRMLFTAILLPGLMIYVMYSFMGEAFSKQFSVAESYQTTLYAVNMPETLKPLFDGMNPAYQSSADTLEDMKKEVENQECDLVIVFPENFEQQIASYDGVGIMTSAPQIDIYYNSSREESTQGYSAAVALLDQFESSMTNRFDVNAAEGINYDLASEKDTTGMLFAALFPMLLMMLIFSACTAIAPESIAGEKERGTLTTLLVTPVKRSEIAVGKIIALSIIALLSGFSSFLGVALSLPKLVSFTSQGEENIADMNVYGALDYIILLAIVICTVLLVISLISVVSAYARTVKEAGTYVSPIMIIVMVLSITSMFGGSAPQEGYWYLIPFYNSIQCMNSIFLFSADSVNVLVTFFSNLVYTGILVAVLAKMFDSEKIMFAKA